ncbi:MAG: glycosyltransferase [Planctomycetota bacterium]
MKKILLLSLMYPRSDNPILGIFVEKQAIALAQHAQVGVLVPVPIRSHVKFGDVIENGFPVWRRPFLSYPGDFLRPVKTLSIAITCLLALCKIYRDFPFDIIHAHGAAIAGVIGIMLGRAYNKPCIITIHGADTTPSEIRRRDVRRILLFSLHNADHVITVSNKLRQEVINLGIRPSSVTVIPNGVDFSVFKHSQNYPIGTIEKPPETKLIITVANLNKSKGHAPVLDSLAQVIRRRPDWKMRYIIIGTGSYEMVLRAKVKELGLADVVCFQGYVPNEQLATYYQAADLFVLPSWSEGFGIVYLESLAMGTPVIACQGQGPTDFVIDGVTGYLVPPRNVLALTDTIERALQIHWDSQRLIANAQQYTWDIVVKKLCQLYGRYISPV